MAREQDKLAFWPPALWAGGKKKHNQKLASALAAPRKEKKGSFESSSRKLGEGLKL